MTQRKETPPPLVHVQGLTASIGQRKLLDSASFSIPRGELVVLVGVSGGGKSTLLRILAGLEDDRSTRRVNWVGSIEWFPADVVGRRGLVFQQPALLDEWTSVANMELAIAHSPRDRSEKEGRTALEWLEHLQVPVDVPISRLSGGQRQRLSLAQSLASGPDVLFYDEPTTGLDRTTANRVAELVRETQEELGVTSIVVTHDVESFLPVANRILVLDPIQQCVIDCTRESQADLELRLANHLRERTREVERASRRRVGWMEAGLQRSVAGVEGVGGACEAGGRTLFGLIPRWSRWGWGMRFFVHYARLVFGGTAMVYLATAGAILGFVATYFTLRYLPYKVYSEPLLMEELLGVIGFALYRIFIPVLTTLLVAARCAAAVSADLGAKRYGGQWESLRMLHVHPDRYWLTTTVWAFVLGSWCLNQIAFVAAKGTSLWVHLMVQPSLGADYWQIHFHQRLGNGWMYEGFGWMMGKLLLCSLGTAGFTYWYAIRPKISASDVSRTITTTILWGTLWVLVVHMLFAFYEF